VKAILKPIGLIAAAAIWVSIYEILIFDRGSYLSKPADLTVSLLLLTAAVLLPFLSFSIWRGQSRGSLGRVLLFVTSIVPAVISFAVIAFGLLMERALSQQIPPPLLQLDYILWQKKLNSN
jgi:hypothetical protein